MPLPDEQKVIFRRVAVHCRFTPETLFLAAS
jgi:hypothetical protein